MALILYTCIMRIFANMIIFEKFGLFFIILIVNYHAKRPRKHVSIIIFLKKHVILIEKWVFHPFQKFGKPNGQNARSQEKGPFVMNV